ncbi:HD domain-containing protein [Paenibacillus thiaminolyticus]|uniref:HD domain-containing protein n=1 Tax=Paenibacillus thiaminolyticus TaxID=49283 RepID=UPI00232B6BAC|nr:HD domain-containing protein [Paenibacillus thiaminolyticus]WCF05753.1 HD domain-containing protein [Paenibacillus thiaminolyticus]
MDARQELIARAERYVREQVVSDSSGHDWWHIHRVRRLAVRLAKEEGADAGVCELAALLHDVADAKFNPSKEAGRAKVQEWLVANGADAAAVSHVMDIVANLSYSGGHHSPMKTLEGQIVQDADRLDAMGAIGIARAFAYAGWAGHRMHEPEEAPAAFRSEEEYRSHTGTAINHFHEKLLKLKDLMNTGSGKTLAVERHRVMVDYLEQFHKEWEAEDR